MGRATGIPDTLWEQRWFIKLTIEEKLLYLYLDSGTRSLSGIYVRTLEDMWYRTRVSQQAIVNALEMGNLKGVKYDSQHEIVFFLDKFRRNQSFGGDPERIAIGIINDYWETKEAISFWEEWCDLYKERVESSPKLTAHFLNPIKQSATPVKHKKRTAETDVDGEKEGEIQSLLARYSKLKPEYRSEFYRIYLELMRSGGGKPLPAAKRLSFLEDLSKYPIDQVGITARMFQQSGGFKKDRPIAWFKGILKKGALSERVEKENRKEKKERGETRE